MADYDWSPITYTPAELEESKRRDTETAKRELEAYDCALAEARRLLISGQANNMHLLQFKNEIAARAKIVTSTSVKKALQTLSSRGEYSYRLGQTLLSENPTFPDEAYLSDYRVVKVPSELTLVEEPELRVSKNMDRKIAGYDFLEKQLNEGATIFVKDKDGNMTEIIFTEDKLK